jgi:hypothetical protein
MSLFKEIQIAAFKDELQKLAKIDVDSNGSIIYHSTDRDTDKKKQDPKNGYELFSEDSAGGTQELQTQPTPN